MLQPQHQNQKEDFFEDFFDSPLKIGIIGLPRVGKTTVCNKNGSNYVTVQLYNSLDIISTKHKNPKHYERFLNYFIMDHLWDFLYTWKYIWKSNWEACEIELGKPVLLDGTIIEDLVFATAHYVIGTISKPQYDCFMNEWKLVACTTIENMRKDYHFIFLASQVTVVMERIKNHGIQSEPKMSKLYLDVLYACYYNVVMCMIEQHIPVRICDWGNFDMDPCSLVNETISKEKHDHVFEFHDLISYIERDVSNPKDDIEKRKMEVLRYYQNDHAYLITLSKHSSNSKMPSPTPLRINIISTVSCWFLLNLRKTKQIHK